MTKKERRRRSAKESSHEKNFQWLVERADRHLSGKRHEINERSEFMNDPAKRRRRRWSGVSDMNDREKAVTSERRNEGIRHLSGKMNDPAKRQGRCRNTKNKFNFVDERYYMQF